MGIKEAVSPEDEPLKPYAYRNHGSTHLYRSTGNCQVNNYVP